MQKNPSNNMQRKTKDIPRIEFIGKKIEIVEAKNNSLVGLKGKIVNETKNMFTLETEEGLTKRIVKKQITLKTKLGGKNFIIEGDILQGRSEERLKKRIKI